MEEMVRRSLPHGMGECLIFRQIDGKFIFFWLFSLKCQYPPLTFDEKSDIININYSLKLYFLKIQTFGRQIFEPGRNSCVVHNSVYGWGRALPCQTVYLQEF